MPSALLGKIRLVIVCTVCDLPLNFTSTPGAATASELEPAIGPAVLRYQAPGSSVRSNSTRLSPEPRTVARNAGKHEARTSRTPIDRTLNRITSLLPDAAAHRRDIRAMPAAICRRGV